MFKSVIDKNSKGENVYDLQKIKEYFLKGVEESWYFEELKEFINKIGKGTGGFIYDDLTKSQKTAIDLGIMSMNDINKAAEFIGISDKQIDDIKQFIINKEMQCEMKVLKTSKYDNSKYIEEIKKYPEFYLVQEQYEKCNDTDNLYDIRYDDSEFISRDDEEFREDYDICEKLVNKKLYYSDIIPLLKLYNCYQQDSMIYKTINVKFINYTFTDARLPFVLKYFTVYDKGDCLLEEYYRLYKLQ